MTMQRYRHDPSKSLVGFVVGEVEYAVDIARVREISNPLPLVGLPHAPRAVVGVADFRGEVVPVVDLRARFGLPASPPTRKTKWLVLDLAGNVFRPEDLPAQTRPPEASDPNGPTGKTLALVVDAVTEVFGTSGMDLRPVPDLGGGSDARGIAGVASHNNGLVFVLDTGKLRDLAVAAVAAAHSEHPAAMGTMRLPARSPT